MKNLTVFFALIFLASANGINITFNEHYERIIGGQIVAIENFPYIVSLRSYDHHICGGSIIAPDTILTAAHCIHKRRPSQFTVRSGSDSADLGTVHKVYKILEHYQYNPQAGRSFDVAKLKIKPPITYSTKSQPIELCSDRPDDDTLLVVSGWGRQKAGIRPSAAERQHLRSAYVQTVNQNECSHKYKNRKINSDMICAAGRGKDSCQGDSGGPLVDIKTGKLCGVASWGIGCANPKYPGVYASVADLLDFIES